MLRWLVADDVAPVEADEDAPDVEGALAEVVAAAGFPKSEAGGVCELVPQLLASTAARSKPTPTDIRPNVMPPLIPQANPPDLNLRSKIVPRACISFAHEPAANTADCGGRRGCACRNRGGRLADAIEHDRVSAHRVFRQHQRGRLGDYPATL